MKELFCTGIASFALTLTLVGGVMGGLTGCGGAMPGGGTIPTLDVEAAIDNPRTFDLSEIAESIEFIPLDDSTPEALLNDTYANFTIAESENRYYVSDVPNKSVKTYDKTGRFVGTVGSVGRGPNEFLFVASMAVDPAVDNLYVVGTGSGGENSVIGYDADGRMFARDNAVQMGWVVFSDGRLVMMRREMPGADKPAPGDKVTILDVFSSRLSPEGKIDGPYKGNASAFVGSVDTGISLFAVGQFISSDGSSILVKEGRSDTVFLYRDDMTLEPACRLEMGRYRIPAELFEGLTSKADWEKYGWVGQIFRGDRYMIVETVKGIFHKSAYLVFDRSEPAADGFSAVGTGANENMLSVGGIGFHPVYVRDNRFVGYMKALDVVDGADRITRPDLAELAAGIKEDSNPVIVVVNLKR